MKASKINVLFIPRPMHYPKNGGVKTSMAALYRAAKQHPYISVKRDAFYADIVQTASSWVRGQGLKPDVYVCHGGFVPPIRSVITNLRDARVIVSVAQWIVNKYFENAWIKKTVVINNGVWLEEFIEPDYPKVIPSGYVLFPKSFYYGLEAFIEIAKENPDLNFVAPLHNPGVSLPNIRWVGESSRKVFIRLLWGAAVVLYTAPEVNPIATLEAWATGTPVVAPNDGTGVSELSNEGRVGAVLYDQRNVRRVLDYAIENAEEIALPGRDKVLNEHDWSIIFEQYVEIYNELL